MTYIAGIVGTGFVGGQHAQGYESASGIELRAAADISEQSLAAFGNEWSIAEERQYTDPHEMLESTDFDAVSITTPSMFHHEHVMAAARSGAEVILCEKPIALSVRAAEEMVDACEDAGVELVINHSRRFNPEYQELKRCLQEDNVIGDVDRVVLRGARELLRNGTHSVDLLLYTVGNRATSVSGYLTDGHGMKDHVVEAIEGPYQDSGGGGTILTADGTIVTVDHTLPRPRAAGFYEFLGSDGRLVIDDGDWRLFEFESVEWEYDTPHVAGGQTYVPAEFPRAIEPGKMETMFSNAADHLVELLNGQSENRSPGREATRVLESLVAMYLSHHTGSWVSIPLARPLKDVRITSW